MKSLLTLGFKKTESVTPSFADLEDTIDVTENLEVQNAATKLEELVEADEVSDPAGVAAGRLADYRLSRLSRALLDRAIVNVAENTGRGMTDAAAKDQALFRGEILANAGHDLGVAIDFIMDAVDTLSAPGIIYNLVFNVQKAVNFIGALTYRQSLDPKGNFDLDKFVDYREEERAAPYGLDPESAFDLNDQRYAGQPDHEIVRDAIEELHIYLQLVTEAFGWDPDAPMPYMFVANPDETFSPVHDLTAMLDIMEVRRQESRAKRDAERTKNLAAALNRSRAMLKAAARK